MLVFIITLISSRFPLHRSSAVPLGAIIISVLCMASACPRPSEDFQGPKYSFEAKLNIIPERKTYQLSDTIWVEYTNPGKEFLDTFSNQRVLVDSVRFALWFQYTNLFNGPDSPATGFADFILPPAMFNNPATYKSYSSFPFTFGCDTNAYVFRVGFVPRYKGVFSLDVYPVTYIRDCQWRSTAFPYSHIFYSFNVIDANKDVYRSIPAANRRDSIRVERQIDAKMTYVFEVQ